MKTKAVFPYFESQAHAKQQVQIMSATDWLLKQTTIIIQNCCQKQFSSMCLMHCTMDILPIIPSIRGKWYKCLITAIKMKHYAIKTRTVLNKPSENSPHRKREVITCHSRNYVLHQRQRVAEEASVRCLQVLWGEDLKILRDKIDKEVVFWDERKHLEFLQLAFRVSTAQW